jgi:hypothetical protein
MSHLHLLKARAGTPSPSESDDRPGLANRQVSALCFLLWPEVLPRPLGPTRQVMWTKMRAATHHEGHRTDHMRCGDNKCKQSANLIDQSPGSARTFLSPINASREKECRDSITSTA